MSRHAFYALIAIGPKPRLVDSSDEYQLSIWRPRLTNAFPTGMRRKAMLAWWAMHHAHGFANRDYAVVTIHNGERLVHHTCVFPGYFRFPFMGRDDLQFGDIWTDPDSRGRGLAGTALAAAMSEFGSAGRRFWYLTETANHASQRVATKAGFEFVGEGERVARYRVRLLGQFVLEEHSPDSRRLAG
ncbi:MAG: GNAT family protein [Planctomycetota bacterium]